MYIKNSFFGESLTYNTQTATNTWIGERTILDSNNYSTYSLTLAFRYRDWETSPVNGK